MDAALKISLSLRPFGVALMDTGGVKVSVNQSGFVLHISVFTALSRRGV